MSNTDEQFSMANFADKLNAKTSPERLQYNFLGRTGLKVSDLCLGAMTFSHNRGPTKGWGMPGIDEQVSHAMLDRFAQVGGNFIDTADIYGTGESEEIVGSWLKKVNREDFVVATKFGGPMGASPNDAGASRKHIIRAVEQSLERLGTHYIDLYQIHMWDSGAPLKETLTTLHDLVRIGKVRYTGCSNYKGFQIQSAVDMANHLNIETFSAFQGQYSLLTRGPELEILPVCQNEGLAYLPWSPLKGGWLSGRYKRSNSGPEAGSRVEWASKIGWTQTNYEAQANERTWRILDAVEMIAKTKQVSMATVALRWVIQRPGITSTIIGARTMAQLEENLQAGLITLTDEEMATLNRISEPHREYPYEVIPGLGRDREGVHV